MNLKDKLDYPFQIEIQIFVFGQTEIITILNQIIFTKLFF